MVVVGPVVHWPQTCVARHAKDRSNKSTEIPIFIGAGRSSWRGSISVNPLLNERLLTNRESSCADLLDLKRQGDYTRMFDHDQVL